MVSMVEQLALDFGFASQEGRYSIGGILSWSLPAMSEVPALAAASWPEPPLMQPLKREASYGRG